MNWITASYRDSKRLIGKSWRLSRNRPPFNHQMPTVKRGGVGFEPPPIRQLYLFPRNSNRRITLAISPRRRSFPAVLWFLTSTYYFKVNRCAAQLEGWESNPRRPEPPDLQSDRFDHLPTFQLKTPDAENHSEDHMYTYQKCFYRIARGCFARSSRQIARRSESFLHFLKPSRPRARTNESTAMVPQSTRMSIVIINYFVLRKQENGNR